METPKKLLTLSPAEVTILREACAALTETYNARIKLVRDTIKGQAVDDLVALYRGKRDAVAALHTKLIEETNA